MTIQEANGSIDRSLQNIQELFLDIFVDIKNNINHLQGLPIVTTPSLTKPNTPNIIKFGVVKPFVWRGETIKNIFEIDANNLSVVDEDRISKLLDRGFLRVLR